MPIIPALMKSREMEVVRLGATWAMKQGTVSGYIVIHCYHCPSILGIRSRSLSMLGKYRTLSYISSITEYMMFWNTHALWSNVCLSRHACVLPQHLAFSWWKHIYFQWLKNIITVIDYGFRLMPNRFPIFIPHVQMQLCILLTNIYFLNISLSLSQAPSIVSSVNFLF